MPLGDGGRGGLRWRRPRRASTGRNCSCEDLLIASRDLLRRDLRDADDDVAVALGGDLGAGHTAGVDALHDDVAGLVELLGGDVCPAAVFGSRMIWVPPSRSRPSLGAVLASER